MLLRAASMRLRRSLCMTMLVALALTQTLGLVHRIVHAPSAAHPAYSVGTAAAQPSSGIGWLKALFAGHSSEQGCDLYDQFSHAGGIPTASALAVVPEAGNPVIAWHGGVPMAAQAAGCLARGPPQAS